MAAAAAVVQNDGDGDGLRKRALAADDDDDDDDDDDLSDDEDTCTTSTTSLNLNLNLNTAATELPTSKPREDVHILRLIFGLFVALPLGLILTVWWCGFCVLSKSNSIVIFP